MLLAMSLIKTFYFNFKYFSWRIAIKLPVIVYKNTELKTMKGNVRLECAPRTGLVEIGKKEQFSLDVKTYRTKWKCDGDVIISGRVMIGSGSVVRIMKGARLRLGRNFSITGRSSIVCGKEITIGDECLFSWDVLLMDMDFHKILINDNVVNHPRPIAIGNHVWIGCRSLLLKGCSLPDDTVVAAGSLITKKMETPGCIVCGAENGIRILKESVNWKT